MEGNSPVATISFPDDNLGQIPMKHLESFIPVISLCTIAVGLPGAGVGDIPAWL